MTIVRGMLCNFLLRALSLYATIFFVLRGLQILGMGLLGETNVRTYYDSQRKPIYAIRERMA